MPVTLTDINVAAARVGDSIGADQEPVLSSTIGGPSESEIEKLLARSLIATVWEAETEYAIGDVVIPTAVNINGLCYVAVAYDTSGEIESGSTEPSWLIGVGDEFQDGHVIWRQNGKAPEALWDIGLAIHLGWKRKQALVASRFDLGLDGRDQLKRSQLFDHFKAMAESTAPFSVA